MSFIDGVSQSSFMQNDGIVRFGSPDSGVNVSFYKRSVIDPIKSREAGRPVYVSKDYVRIQHPGEPNNVIDRPIADDPRVMQRWPNQYQRFQNNQQDIPEGTPLEVLFPTQPELPANLHTQAVHTVEQLANLSAHALQSIGMGSVEWQGMARRFLDSAKGGQEHHKLVKQVEDLNNQNQVLSNQVSLLKVQLDRLLAQQQGINPMMIPQRLTSAQQYSQTLPDQSFNQEPQQYAGPFDHQEALDLPLPKQPRTSRNKG